MNFCLNFRSIVSTLFLIKSVLGVISECPPGDRDRVRTFESLQKLRGNEIPFNVDHPKYEGNSVVISGTTIEKLEKNSFYCETCEYIIFLNLSSHNIHDIDDGAFTNLNCVQELDLNANTIASVFEETFGGMRNLKKLNLRNNNLEIIKNKTFSHLYMLTELDLSDNDISDIESYGFYNLTSLEFLSLRNNQLMILNLEVFRQLKKLKQLNLSTNKITMIQHPLSRFDNNLEFLDLSNNSISEAIEGLNLVFLKTLNLNNNKLKYLDGDALKINYPRLTTLELVNNLWECSLLKTMLRALEKHRIRYTIPVKCVKTRDEKYSDVYLPKFEDRTSNSYILVVIATTLSAIYAGLIAIHTVWSIVKFYKAKHSKRRGSEDIALVNQRITPPASP